MTEWIIDREHPLKGAVRGLALLVTLLPIVTAFVLLVK